MPRGRSAGAGEAMILVNVRLPRELIERADALIVSRGTYERRNRSAVIRLALERGLPEIERRPARPPEETPAESTLDERILTAMRVFLKGHATSIVTVAWLRGRFPELPREVFDRTLFQLGATGKLRLVPVTDPSALTPEDRVGAIRDELRGTLGYVTFPPS